MPAAETLRTGPSGTVFAVIASAIDAADRSVANGRERCSTVITLDLMRLL
ncbi:MAG: hypothetical protein ACOH2Q_08650 [Rhodococcus sp. (in: high G+C Gram-positive bacteria)]